MTFKARPHIRCMKCDALPEVAKKQGKAKTTKKKFRTKQKTALNKFTRMYKRQLKKMHPHKYHVILLGKEHKKKARNQHAQKRLMTLKMERDFSERLVMNPDCQAQCEYFARDVSLGMEGITVFFKLKDKELYETRF